jgi:hypothetical protein
MTTALRLGTVTPSALKVGALDAPKAYLGPTLVWDKTAAAFGPSETILVGTPEASGQQTFKVGNTYLPHVAGQIVGARFWRPGATMPGIETTHVVQVYNAAHVLVATSEPSVGETPAYTGWVAVTFAAPIPIVTGAQFTTAVDLPMASAWSTTNFAVVHPASVTYATGVYGTCNDPAFPTNASTGFNFFVDAMWQPALAAEFA